MALALPDGCFDAAISVFGVILFPDADLGMREIARVLKPGGRTAIVTWTQTERYELAARLIGGDRRGAWAAAAAGHAACAVALSRRSRRSAGCSPTQV